MQHYPVSVSKLPSESCYVAAGVAQAEPDINPEGIWIETFEKLANSQFWRNLTGTLTDTYGCVTHSMVNEVEQQTEAQGVSLFLCDRFLVVASGTVPRVGNDGDQVAETLRLKGVPKASDAPCGENMTEDAYYAMDTSLYAAKAAQFLKAWRVAHGWVDTWDAAATKAALRKAPLQIYIPSLGYKDGLWYMAGAQIVHAVLALSDIHAGDWFLGDSYRSNDSFIKRVKAGQKPYRWAKLVTVRPIAMTKEQKTAALTAKYKDKVLFCNENGAKYLVLGANEANPHGRVCHLTPENEARIANIRLDYGISGAEHLANVGVAEVEGVILTEL
jgi:hypothetical protein